MKNLWLVLVGMFTVFTLFFILFTDWSFDTLLKKPHSTKIQQHIQTDITVQDNTTNTMTVTTTSSTSNIPSRPQVTKENTKESSLKELPEDEQIYKEEISEAFPEEVEIKTTKKSIVQSSILNIVGSTKVKMKIKAKEKDDGIAKAKVSISHDMLTYAQAKKKGRKVNFIIHITGRVGQRVVYDASTSQFLSKNPLMKFSFKGKKGEILTILYRELNGNTYYDSKKIK